MADYEAVLRKTIDGLGETTPEIRKKVYEKARATISKKLMAIDPPPPKEMFDRQMKALEVAVEKVEAHYGGSDESTLNGPEFGLDLGPEISANDAPVPPEAPVIDSFERERWDEQDNTPPRARTTHKRRGGRGLIWTLVILVVLGGGGYFAWANQDRVVEYFELALAGIRGSDDDSGQPVDDGGSTDPTAAEKTAAGGEDGERPERSTTKFTQRLTPDGREIDEGPAAGEPTVGEGTSIASPTQDTGAEEPSAETGDSQPTTGEQAATGQPAVPVGQKAIFYEERTSAAEGSAQSGAVVWSVVQESPGGDFPPEPAIRGDVTVPTKGVSLRMTFRRNADKTLPASHIIELVFVTPEDFDGGTIDGVLRIAMKDSEQATGNPLIGIPAKIADGFFLLALTDAKAEVETNTTLLRRQSWIDIPIAYGTGRRALITMEKGVPGDKVFDEVLTAWQKAAEGTQAN